MTIEFVKKYRSAIQWVTFWNTLANWVDLHFTQWIECFYAQQKWYDVFLFNDAILKLAKSILGIWQVDMVKLAGIWTQ